MPYTNFIAAINIGTAQITGMVGERTTSGSLNILATEMEKSEGCIRRGCVYNVEETAAKARNLLGKLEGRLGGAKIAKVYLGVGGYSLRSQDYSVCKPFEEELDITGEVISELFQQCKSYTPEFSDVLDIVSPVYLLDGKRVVNPVGIPCSSVEAKYKLIVARPSIRRHALNSFREKAKIEVIDILVAPLALADVVLNEDEKNLGCALVDFGAGTTKVIIYKDGLLQDLSVIPLGGDNITKDITSLNIVASEAEQLKLEYGSVLMDIEDETLIPVQLGAGQKEIRQSELNNIIEARSKEIVDNVIARIESAGLLHKLGAGLVITGEASGMRGLASLIREKAKMNMRFASLHKGLLSDDKIITLNTEYMEVAGLLMHGSENCAAYQEQPYKQPVQQQQAVQDSPQQTLFTEEETGRQEPVKKESKGEKPSKKPFGWLKKGIDNLSRDLFTEEPGNSNNDN